MRLRAARVFVILSALITGSANISLAWADATPDGFYVYPSAGNWGVVALDGNFRVIQTLSLPQGQYIANATAALESTTPGFLSAECHFQLNGMFLGDLSRGTIGGASQNFLMLPLTVGFTLSSPLSLELACRGDFGVRSQPSPITAIRVKRLAVQKGMQPE